MCACVSRKRNELETCVLRHSEVPVSPDLEDGRDLACWRPTIFTNEYSSTVTVVVKYVFPSRISQGFCLSV